MARARERRTRDQYIKEKLASGALFSDIITEVQQNFGGSYTMIARMVERQAHVLMGSNLSMTERRVQYKAILDSAWQIYKDATEARQPKVRIAALNLLIGLVGACELVESAVQENDDTMPNLEIVENSA